MQIRGPLMTEHRLIMRMLKVVSSALDRAREERSIDPVFVDTAVDFIKVYADRTHHGKEEDIMFAALADKELTADQQRVLGELNAEHVVGRETTAALVDANSRYREGDEGALAEVLEHLGSLAEFYPRHIDKEDKEFFPSIQPLFSREEEDAILEKYWEFDKRMIHEKYESLVNLLLNS